MSEKKTLLPEFLPRPQGAAGATPPERVAARARSLLDRFKRLGPMASAAVLSVHCTGYSVVDPVPPPPGLCRDSSDDRVFTFDTSALFEEGVGNPSRMQFTLQAFDRIGYQFGTPQVVRGGRLVEFKDNSSTDDMFGRTQLDLIIAVTESEVLVDIDVGCEGRNATKHYRLRRIGTTRLVEVEEMK